MKKIFFSFFVLKKRWKATSVCELSRNKLPKPESWFTLMVAKYQWENIVLAWRNTGQTWITGKEKMECFVKSSKSLKFKEKNQEYLSRNLLVLKVNRLLLGCISIAMSQLRIRWTMWQASALTILWLLSSPRASTRKKKMTELWCWAVAGTALGPGNSLWNIALYSNGDIIKH